jgi:protocatechuate 3,4-dioxygenase alpha subunit
MSLQATTSQTVGPFFKIGLNWLYRDNLVEQGVSGERVTVRGRVIDGDGNGVPDAILEIWQANAYGRYAHPEDQQEKPLEPGFLGFGRVPTDLQGGFLFATIKPGPVPSPDGQDQAPHLVISLFMRGLLRRLTTRMYFPNDPRNATDPILNLAPPARRPTLIAESLPTGMGALEWNLIMQGPNETVFFDLGL